MCFDIANETLPSLSLSLSPLTPLSPLGLPCPLPPLSHHHKASYRGPNLTRIGSHFQFLSLLNYHGRLLSDEAVASKLEISAKTGEKGSEWEVPSMVDDLAVVILGRCRALNL